MLLIVTLLAQVTWTFREDATHQFELEERYQPASCDVAELRIWNLTWKVARVDRTGRATVELTFDRVRRGVGEVVYDTKERRFVGGAPPGDENLLCPDIHLAGRTLTLGVDPDGHIRSISGIATVLDVMVKSMKGPSAERFAASARRLFSDAAMLAHLQQVFPKLTAGRGLTINAVVPFEFACPWLEPRAVLAKGDALFADAATLKRTAVGTVKCGGVEHVLDVTSTLRWGAGVPDEHTGSIGKKPLLRWTLRRIMACSRE